MTEKYTPTKAKIDPPLPPEAWDTHFHIFPPGAEASASPPFVPPRIPMEEEERFHRELGTPNNVLAHSFVFGTNLATLDEYLAAPARGVRRGIACVGDDTSSADIQRMQAEGVRGIRAQLNASTPKEKAKVLKSLFERLDKAGVHWTVCVQEAPTPEFWDALLSIFDSFPSSQILMIDHMGFLPGPWGESPPETVDAEAAKRLPHVEAVLALLSRANTAVKLSAPYRITTDYASLEGLVKACAAAAPDRIVWASDWPFVPLPHEIQEHKDVNGDKEEIKLRTEDMPRWIALLRSWLGEDLFNKMMVDNAARLYAQ